MELIDIKGLGKTRVLKLNSAGINSVEDLLNHLPKKYYDFARCDEFVQDGANHLFCVKLVEDGKTVRAKAGLSFVVAKAKMDRSGEALSLVWYGQTYVAQTLKNGEELYVYGKFSPTKRGQFVVSMHKFCKNTNAGVLGVYKTMEGVGQLTLSKSISEALSKTQNIGLMGERIEKTVGLMPLKNAYSALHFPQTVAEIDPAFERLNLENALVFAHINAERKVYEKQNRERKFENVEAIFNEFKRLLPFELTASQIQAIGEINADLTSPKTMNRMVQGDVGCGKTVVALWAMFLCAKHGYSAVLMAPTEILASQHYALAKRLFKGEKFGVGLLTSGLSKPEKTEVLKGIMSGNILMVFGTQSVLSAGVKYPNLQLVVADEQHRFGVNERAKLAEKGSAIDTLTMSATPIPRSVSLVLFGGLDITRINARPHPQNTQTNLVPSAKAEDMWRFIGSEIENGRTCYVVCPKIDDEEERDALVSTTQMAKTLKEKFGECVAELNGRMKESQKAEILSAFKDGKVKILVSTTVVEVGVDSLNAGVIVVVNPERFGLATLHQLRGRVGRDGRKSYCFCLIGDGVSMQAGARLTFFKNNSNGFDIADFDLKNRGAGDAYGTRQHGASGGMLPVDLSTYERANLIYNQFKTDNEFLLRVNNRAQATYTSKLSSIILN